MYKYLFIFRNEIRVIIKTSLVSLVFISILYLLTSNFSFFQLVTIDLLISSICSIFYLIFIRDSWWSFIKNIKDCLFFIMVVMLITLFESGVLYFLLIKN